MPFAPRRKISSGFRFPAALAALLYLAAPIAVRAADDPLSPSAHGGAAIPGTAHLRIARDPETGGWTLAPLTAAEALRVETEMALNQSAAGLVAEALPGGGYAMDLQGRFQSYSLARRGAGGGLEMTCDENPLDLFRWLSEVPGAVDAQGRPTR